MNLLQWIRKFFKSVFSDKRIEPEHESHEGEENPNRQQSRKRSTSQSAKKSTNRDRSSTSTAKTSEEHIERIKKCKDYYEVLQVSKKYDEITLKKRYRELALKLHPDKCQSAGASEAFKSVGNAYATLSDPKKRQVYDAELKYGQRAGSTQTQNFYGHRMNQQQFDDFMTANDVFNMFFGGGFPSTSLFQHQNVFFQPGTNVRVNTWTFTW